MKPFLKYLGIQFKMDLRDRGILMTYYLVPLLFFAVIGSVFSSINPLMKPTLAASMSIFAVTMGAVMGSPIPIVKARESGTLRAFRVNGIPDAVFLAIQGLSAFLHLAVVSAVIYFISPYLLHSQVPEFPLDYAAVLLVLLLTSIGIGLLIGTAAPNQSAASMLSMIVFFPTVMLSGIMFPSSMLPVGFRRFGLIFPATHAMQAFYGLAYGMKTDFSPFIALSVLAGIGLLAFLSAGFCFSSIRQSEQA